MIKSGAEIMTALKRELGWSKAKIKNMEITVIQLSAMLTDGNRDYCANVAWEKHWEDIVDNDKKTIREAEKNLEKML